MKHKAVECVETRSRYIVESLQAFAASKLLKLFRYDDERYIEFNLINWFKSYHEFLDASSYSKILFWKELDVIDLDTGFKTFRKMMNEIKLNEFYHVPYSFDENRPDIPIHYRIEMYEKFPEYLSSFKVVKK